jgi:hypothetical protein
MFKQKNLFKTIAVSGLTVFLSVLIIYSIVRAGSLTPSGSDVDNGVPTSTSYTLTDIYNRLNTNTTAIAGNHSFTAPVGTPASTLYTLSQIYSKIPTINPANLLSSTTYLGITGSIVPRGAFGLSASSSSQSVSAGYYIGGTLVGDADLIASNIKSTVNIFGVVGNYGGGGYTYGSDLAKYVLTSAGAGAGTWNAANLTSNLVATGTSWGTSSVGTLLGHLFNGSAGTNVSDYAFYPLNRFDSFVGASNSVLGFFSGVDDYNKGDNSGGFGVMPAGSYTGSWSACNLGNHYCGAGDSAVSAEKKDNSTGLVWSTLMDSGSGHTWFWANNCYEPGTPIYNPVACDVDDDDGCQCVKKPSGSKVGCESLDSTGGNTLGPWRTPTQKELMQAYIDGSWGYLSSAANDFWSGVTTSYDTHYGWLADLSYGYTRNSSKVNTYAVRCVR